MSTISTTVTSAVYVGPASSYTSPLTVTSTGAVIDTSAGHAVYANSSATVVNYGSISESAGSIADAGVYLLGGGSVDNHGAISSDSVGIDLKAAGQVTNSGTVEGAFVGVALYGGGSVTNAASASITGGNIGVFVIGAAGAVYNSGAIAGTNAEGIYLAAGGSVTNTASGSITGGSAGIVVKSGSGAVYNAGTIAGGGGVYLVGTGGSVTNTASGSITGGYYGVFIAGASGTVDNAGLIAGTSSAGISFVGAYNDTVVDSGTIIGTSGTAVAFAGGDDLMQFQPGYAYIAGTIDGGAGVNTLEFASGSSAGTLTGAGAYFNNFSNGTVDSGASWVLAGSVGFGPGVTMTISGELDDAGTVGNAGSMTVGSTGKLYIDSNATFDNSGTITAGSGAALYGGGSIYLSNAASGTISGGDFGVDAGSGTVINAGVIAGTASIGVSIGDYSNVTNAAGATISGGDFGVDAGNYLTLVNDGVVAGTASMGLFIGDYSNVTNAAGATISGGTYGIDAGNYLTLANDGVIAGTASMGLFIGDHSSVTNTAGATISGGAYGIDAGNYLTVVNDGVITGTASMGLFIGNNVYVSNASGGTISGSTFGIDAGNGVTVLNAGSVSASGTAGVGIYLYGGGSVTNAAGAYIGGYRGIGANGAATIDNFGVIQGSTVGGGTAIGLGAIYGGAGIYLYAGGSVTNEAGGTISGYVGVYASGGGTVTNSGVIEATGNSTIAFGGFFFFNAGVVLRYGGELVNTAGATISGSLGALAAYGSITNEASGVISGTYLGVAIGGPSATTLANSGAISGGLAGVLAAGALVLNRASGSIYGAEFGVFFEGIPGTIDNYGTISGPSRYGVGMYGGGSITNHAGAAITSTYGTGIYFANGDGAVENAGAIAGGIDGVYFTGTSAGVYVVTNAAIGTIIGGYRGVAAAGYATVINSGLMQGGVQPISVAGTALVAGGVGVYLADGGSVTNEAGGTITGYLGVLVAGASGTVINYGAIQGTGTNSTGYSFYNTGVYLRNGGTVINKTGGTLSGWVGVDAKMGSVTNRGHIAGSIIGVELGQYTSNNLVNYGTISGGTSGVDADYAVTNAISGTISGGAGIFMHGIGATVANYGRVVGYGTGAFTAGVEMFYGGTLVNKGLGRITSVHGYGVLMLDEASTVENAGTISGAIGAVYFAGTYANRLIVDPYAVFNGAVAANTGGTNTLEVAATAKGATAMLSGFGGQFTGFQTLQFDVGASWRVAGSFTGTTAIAGFHPSDVLDLTSVAWSPGNTVQLTSGDVLEILNSSSTVLWSVQLLNLSLGMPDYSGDTFSIAYDGHGGTDVTVAPTNQPPVLAVPGAQTDTAKSAISIGGVSITDADNGYSHEAFTVTVSDATGLLSAVVRDGGMVSGAGTNTLTLTGTLVQVNAELATLTYTGAALGGDTISISVNDGRGGSDNKSIGVTVNPATASWVGSSLAAWGNAGNWSGGKVPNDGLTNAVIALGAASPYKVKIYAGQSFTVNQLTIGDAKASFIVAGSLAAAAGVTDTAGDIAMQGGTLTGALSMATGTKLFGIGTLAGAVANSGRIEARDGLLDITGAVTGSGMLQVDLKSTLELGGDAASQTIAFNNGTPGNSALARPVLILDQPSGSFGTITGFALGDTIDLKNTAATSDSYAGGVLTVFNGTTTVATLTIAGSFASDKFALSDDGHGGTNIILTSSSAGIHSGPITADRQATQLVQAIAAHAGTSSVGDLVALERPWLGAAAGAFAASIHH
jgi:hypothetical protein